jgi:ABC-type proline/glycine betaine transport system permease subunit
VCLILKGEIMIAADFAVIASVITSGLGIISILRDVKKDSLNAAKERSAMLSELQIVVYRVTRIELCLDQLKKEKNENYN